MRKVEIRGMSVGKLLAAAVIAVAGAGSADARDWAIELSAFAGQFCSLPDATSTTKNFDEAIVGSDGQVNTDELTVFQRDSASCNYNAQIAIKSAKGALVKTLGMNQSLPAGMINKIKYHAKMKWGETEFTLDANRTDGPSSSASTGPINAPVIVSIIPVADTATLLLHGNYTDTLTLTIGIDP